MTFIHITSDINSPETQAIIKCWEIFHTLPKLVVNHYDWPLHNNRLNIEFVYRMDPASYWGDRISIPKLPGKSPEEIYFYAKDKLMNHG